MAYSTLCDRELYMWLAIIASVDEECVLHFSNYFSSNSWRNHIFNSRIDAKSKVLFWQRFPDWRCVAWPIAKCIVILFSVSLFTSLIAPDRSL